MYTIYTNNETCTYCLKAKALLDAKNIEYTYKVISSEDLMHKFPRARTVPQIMKDKEYIGGYTELEALLRNASKEKTVFNTENTGHLTGEYPLFFGEQLGFVDTINTPYPILDELFQAQMAQIWNEFEVDLAQDRQDMLNVERSKVDLVVLNLLWQTLVDSVANRSITGLLMQYVTNSDLEAWYNAVALFETIHARTYSHIIKQTFVDPNQALVDGYNNEHVLKRANSITKAFNDVANLKHDESEDEIKRKVYVAIAALYLLESVNFMSSFSVTFGVAETGVFQGISQDVVLICRDEMLHAKGGKEILSIEKAELAKYRDSLQELFDNVIQEEMEWNDYLFSEGRQCVGLNVKLAKDNVKYLAAVPADVLGVKFTDRVHTNPYPFMDNYIDSSKVQVAAQELQLTAYLLNTIQAAEDLEGTLERLKELFSEEL